MADSLTRLRALAEAATPGPWLLKPGGYSGWQVTAGGDAQIAHCTDRTVLAERGYRTEYTAEAHAAYIAALSPAVVLALLAVAEAAEQYEGEEGDPTDPLMRQRLKDALAALVETGGRDV